MTAGAAREAAEQLFRENPPPHPDQETAAALCVLLWSGTEYEARSEEAA